MIVGAFFQYHHCVRIYNRFKFDEKFTDKWEKDETDMKIRDSDEVPTNPMLNSFRPSVGLSATSNNSVNNINVPDNMSDMASVASSRGTMHIMAGPTKDTKQKKSILKRLFHISSKSNHTENIPNNSSVAVGHSSGITVTSSQKLFKQGYAGVVDAKGKWERFYIVLSGRRLWLYKDKYSFDTDPEHPVRLRPLAMEDFTSTGSAASNNYTLTLTPLDMLNSSKPNIAGSSGGHGLKSWIFKFDMLEEMEGWLNSFQVAAALPSSDANIAFEAATSGSAHPILTLSHAEQKF
jgi:hypothetical protein